MRRPENIRAFGSQCWEEMCIRDRSKEAADKAASEEAPAEIHKTEEPAKEMSNTNLIVVQKSKEPSVPTIRCV